MLYISPMFLCKEYLIGRNFVGKKWRKNCLVTKFFMTKNPKETEINVIICPFFGCFILFLISLKTYHSFNTIGLKNLVGKKNLSVKSDEIFSKWRKFLPMNIFYGQNFPPTKFLPIRYMKMINYFSTKDNEA